MYLGVQGGPCGYQHDLNSQQEREEEDKWKLSIDWIHVRDGSGKGVVDLG